MADDTTSSYREFCIRNLRELQKKNQSEYDADPSKYSCAKCLDRGKVYVYDEQEDDIVSVKCECYQSKVSQALARTSGFGFMLDTYKFENFIADTDFQKNMLGLAKGFCDDDEARWFFLGGQSGVGKTHLCTAIANHYIEQGISTKYICWNSWATNLKKLFNNPDEYYKNLDEVLNVKVLFLDDLFKGATARDTQPTEADIKLAFEVINGRYLSTDKITIISSEWFMGDLITFDEGTFSRVFQGCGKYQCNIKREEGKNFRTRAIVQKVLKDRRGG